MAQSWAHDVSILDQKRQGEAYCAARGYQLVETYVEPGASATNDRRPEFQRMIEAGTSKPAPFDVVIVHSFSRFFRHAFDMESHVTKPAKNGVMRAFKENARQGFWNGSLPPIGYRVVAAKQRGAKTKKKLELDPLHAETVRLIYRLALPRRWRQGPDGCQEYCQLPEQQPHRPALDDRIDGLKAIRDQAKADAERAQAMLQHSESHAFTPQMLSKFARTARQRIRLEGGGYRCDHLRALAQRVKIADGEVRTIGSSPGYFRRLWRTVP